MSTDLVRNRYDAKAMSQYYHVLRLAAPFLFLYTIINEAFY